MIDQALAWLSGQPFLVAGIGTVLSSALMYMLRSIPTRLIAATSELLTSVLSVNTRNDYFQQVDAYVSRCVIPWTFRRYEPADRADEGDVAYLNAGYGSGYGAWRGMPFHFVKTIEKEGYQFQKTIRVRFLTRSRSRIEAFMNAAIDFRRGEPRQRIYISSSSYWERMADKRLRSLETVFANDGVIEAIVGAVSKFLASEDWYLTRGIPYKLIVMLYGAPGTGKTSLIHAVASNFGLDIDYVTALGNLGRLLSSKTSRRSLVVIEDIDTLARRERDARNNANRAPTDPLAPVAASDASNAPAYPPPQAPRSLDEMLMGDDRALHDALNSFDGFTTQHGVIIFLTSNHPETLDSALTRVGRVDLSVAIGPLEMAPARRMFCAFYGDDSLPLWDQWAHSYSPMTGAALQSHFMNAGAEEVLKRMGAGSSER